MEILLSILIAVLYGSVFAVLFFHFKSYLYLKKHYPEDYKDYHYRPMQFLAVPLEDFIKQRPRLFADANLANLPKVNQKLKVLFLVALVMILIMFFVFHAPLPKWLIPFYS